MTPPDFLVDTSVAVALTVEDHEAHEQTISWAENRTLGLAGHAAFETFSVLTRLPAPARRTPAAVARIISVNFPETRFLGVAAASELLKQLAERGTAGGSVYDAMVGAAAVEHEITLATRDRRAVDTYRTLGARLEILS